MRELDHPNVVNVLDFYAEESKYFYLVLKYMEGGELFSRIVKKVCTCKNLLGDPEGSTPGIQISPPQNPVTVNARFMRTYVTKGVLPSCSTV